MLNIMEQKLDTDPVLGSGNELPGLTAAEAAKRLERDGPNTRSARRKKTALKIFANQFHDVMVMILLISTVISVLLGRYTDAVPIIAVVIINSFLGFIQEYRCEKTIERLQEMTAPTARVCRSGRTAVIPAAEVVSGDVFRLEAGDRVPADGFIISCRSLCCDESLLTGEAEPAAKRQRREETDLSAPGADYMVYMGTVVTKGTALVETTAVGRLTQMGKVSKMLEDIEEGPTPLQKKLSELGRTLALICIVICLIVFAAGLLRGEPLMDMVMTAITIAIAAIPEGLPAAVTIALALAVRKMLKRNALVHRLHSVETLGCATVICTDKTGTVTQNKMTVVKLTDSSGRALKSSEVKSSGSKAVKELLICGAMCSNALIEETRPSVIRKKVPMEKFRASGDPTECAISVFCAGCGILSVNTGFKRVDEIPFDSISRSMTVICQDDKGQKVSFKKGSAEVVTGECGLRLCDDGPVPFTAAEKLALLRVVDSLAGEGLRVLAFSELSGGQAVFLGLMAMQDPPRPEAAKAVRACEKAGITTVMITGDHKLTAGAIARQVGIMKNSGLILTGSELDRLTDEKLSDIISNCRVFARVTPAHKLRIVRAFKSRGNVVAMTGDGVNDAPAVKEADIGVSMGIQGTEVTKQAADVILLDDDFATLVKAVEEGRTIYYNIRKFVRYMISCNIGEVVTMFGGIMMGLPMVLLPAQILLVNLVTDSLPAVALGLEPSEDNVMSRSPRREEDSFFSGGLLWRIILRGLLIGICTLGTFTCILKSGCSLSVARTGALITLVMSQLIHVFECKSEEKTLFSVPYFSNPFLLFAVAVSSAALFAGIYVPALRNVFSAALPDLRSLGTALGFSFLVPVLSGLIYSRRKKPDTVLGAGPGFERRGRGERSV
ncbi:MAG: cation-translocating P-type ATPase [Ruminococcus sp.]|nr:cation-translocating P-type ATPase [Ruminococcus sp.]